MADSIRQQIITKLDTRLKAILIASGYKTNLGQRVFDWRDPAFGQTDLAGLSYRDVSTGNVETVTIAWPDSLQEFPLTVEMELKGTTPAVMRQMMADVLKAIGVDPTWDGLAISTEYLGDETDTEEQEAVIGATTMRILITYRTKAWDPYNQ
jgi:hypothetical protein